MLVPRSSDACAREVSGGKRPILHELAHSILIEMDKSHKLAVEKLLFKVDSWDEYKYWAGYWKAIEEMKERVQLLSDKFLGITKK